MHYKLINMDARIKLLWLISSASIYFTDNIYLIIVMLTNSLLMFLFSKSQKSIYFKALVYAFVFFIIIFIITLYENTLFQAGIILARWLTIILSSIAFFVIITPFELIAALRSFKMPEFLTFSLGMGFRFIPIIIEEAGKIALAQKSRGLNYGRGLGKIPKIPTVIFALIIPLFIRILARLNDTLLALKMKGFVLGRRKKPQPVALTVINFIFLIYSLAIIACTILL